MQIDLQLRRVERRPERATLGGDAFGGVERIVVARRDRLGDFVLTLPALAAIRRTYPASRLAALVAPAIAPLARLVDGIDEVWEAPPRADDLVRRFRDQRTDLLISISRDVGTAWAAWRGRVPHRVGSARRAYSVLFTRRVDESRRAGGRHEAEFALSFAHRCGAAPGPADFSLSVPPAASEAVAAFRTQQGVDGRYVVVHPGSGGSCPRWPSEHFARLVEMLHAHGVAAVVSLGPGEPKPEVEAPVATFTGDLPRLAALLAGSALVVGNSTGPIHLAAALATPTLALHAPWRSCGVERFGPYAANGWGLVAEHPPAHEWSRAERRRRGAELMAAISPAAVRDAALTILAGKQPV